MRPKKNIRVLAAAIALTAAGLAAGGALFLSHPVKSGKLAFIYIDGDDTADSVFAKLKRDLHADRLTGVRLLASLRGYGDGVRTGAYRFGPDDSAWQLYHRLEKGRQTPVRLVVPGVRTVGRLLQTVGRQLMADSASIARLLDDSTRLARLGYDRRTLPAFFVPNTYEVYWDMDAEEFVRRMQKEHDRFWNRERTERARAIGLTPVQVGTLASIVEEETAVKEERPMVAGLYMNRLRRGMLLQADPTVKFGLQQFGLRRIRGKHLQADSPYNTYRHEGLPPGPIRIPSIEGIESVLGYARHDYLYMCAKEDFSGTHRFARTWEEHKANARRYQQALNRRNIR